MGIWRYVNCSTCVHNQCPLEDHPCKDCGNDPMDRSPFTEWEPKFSLDELKVKKEGD